MAKRKKTSIKKDPTKAIRERAVKILATGTFRETTRRRLEVSNGLWSAWIREGKAERQALDEGTITELGPRGLFVEAIEKAEGEAHDRILRDGVLNAGPEAQRWYLQRRWPELYSTQPARGVMDDDAGELVKVDPRDILKEKLRELLEGSEGE